MRVQEAGFTETPYGRYVTSDGWFVLNVGAALAVRNEEKGGAASSVSSPPPGAGTRARNAARRRPS